jgi:hypothetical protein
MTHSDTEQTVLNAMLDGDEMLTLVFYDGKPIWELMCSGQRISARTAQHIIDSIDDAEQTYTVTRGR